MNDPRRWTDQAGEANLTYTWATIGAPPAPVTFSANGTNAAKNTTATFAKAGTYAFQVTISNAATVGVISGVKDSSDLDQSGSRSFRTAIRLEW